MFGKHDVPTGAKPFQRARRDRRPRADQRCPAERRIPAAVVLASTVWCAAAASGEAVSLLAPANAPNRTVARSEVTVSSHTDTQHRLVREVTVRLVVMDEVPPADRHIEPGLWEVRRGARRELAEALLEEAFTTAAAALDGLVDSATPPTTSSGRPPPASEVAATVSPGATQLVDLMFEPAAASRPIIAAHSVPEPGALALLGVASIPLWSHERRSRRVGSCGNME